ncbi:hypothetical protein ACLOJK_029259 [Asimina triloba]
MVVLNVYRVRRWKRQETEDFMWKRGLTNGAERLQKSWEGERDSTMKKKEYKAYFSLAARRAVTVVDLLPALLFLLLAVKSSYSSPLRGM